MEKKITNAFTGRCDGYVQDVHDFDQFYINRKVIQVVKKTGEGETDFVLEDKVIDEQIPIKEVVNADADSCGVYNILNKVLKSGDDSILNIDNSGSFCDATQYPEDLHQAKQQLDAAADAYSNRGAIFAGMSLSDMSKLTDEQLKVMIDEYISKQAEQKSQEKKED